jgi:hypothetical protein
MSPRQTDPASEPQPQDEPSDAASATPSVEVVDDRRKGLSGWAMSAAIHAMILLSMAFVVYAKSRPDVEYPPVIGHVQNPIPLPPPVSPQTPDEPIPTNTIVDNDPTTPDTPQIPTMDPEGNTDDPNANDPQTDGDPHNVAVVSDSDSANSFAVIGGGGGNPGAKGTPGGRRHGHMHGPHGTPHSVKAFEDSLRWFKKHQSPNGGWEAVKYFSNCSDDGPKCEPGTAQPGNYDAAMTGYVLLCYIGAGYDHVNASKYRPVIKRAVENLLAIQDQDGRFGPRNYEHAIATMALAEEYAVTDDPALKAPCQKAVDAILRAQNQGGDHTKDPANVGTSANGLGWDYGTPTARNDASVSGWNIMALKSALGGGLNVGDGLNGAKRYLDNAWKATNPDWAKLDPYTGESRFPYTWDTNSGAVDIAPAPAPHAKSADGKDLTCVALTCAIYLGHHEGDPMLETLANHVMDHEMPTSWPTNTYKMYYNTLSMFQIGGKRFETWDAKCRDMLVASQRKDDGCFAGSWDPAGTAFPGNDVGRVMCTALCCLTLEVYFRHEKIDLKNGHT